MSDSNEPGTVRSKDEAAALDAAARAQTSTPEVAAKAQSAKVQRKRVTGEK